MPDTDSDRSSGTGDADSRRGLWLAMRRFFDQQRGERSLRRQIEETVSWAGDPRKPVTAGPNGERLTPRKSFEVWRETVSGRSIPWAPQEMHSAERLRMILLEVFLKMTDAANDERERNQQQQQLLISELNHRVRNILNLMRGLLAQSRASTSTLEEFTANLDGRIQALGRAHDALYPFHIDTARDQVELQLIGWQSIILMGLA